MCLTNNRSESRFGGQTAQSRRVGLSSWRRKPACANWCSTQSRATRRIRGALECKRILTLTNQSHKVGQWMGELMGGKATGSTNGDMKRHKLRINIAGTWEIAQVPNRRVAISERTPVPSDCCEQRTKNEKHMMLHHWCSNSIPTLGSFS